MKISVIFGTRPEAIKLAPVILALKKKAGVDCRVCVTGQHRQMLDQVLEVFGIVPDVDLKLMQPNQTLGGLTSRAVAAIDAYLAEDRPDVVLVQGDTTTVMAAALAAFYHKIPVGHVEAGLRTGNLQSPWPEEMNRVVTTRLARWHFAPTESNRKNLLGEGIADADISVTGNTVIDALYLAKDIITGNPPQFDGLPGNDLSCFGDRKVVLITGHRRENFGDGFEDICRAITTLVETHPDVDFVYPVHLNPKVKEPVERILGKGRENLYLIEPQAYLQFVALMNRASIVLTDSGGVQEEAPSLGKPVLVMRDTSERMEAVTAGCVKLVGTDQETIVCEVSALLQMEDSSVDVVSPYGDGQAAQRILEVLGV
ncbi:MAG TPA: UDP-N-acetylglucosamine 2-epimerase (non-hydrolyzing) [Opitutae bacterium]|jgi:UDP-N-acetylglucosamine 2-epimerase (non-hydrolysing)|nr:UDP-N-acetylglucosamine 2-epimerase (non-hydrolyzing) [Opitutae bacterium]